MAHMGCSCGNDMWDGDGHIVCDVFSKNDLTEYIQNGKINNKFEDIYDNYPPFYEENTYFWLCDECKEVHMWFYTPKYCYRTYKLRKEREEISIESIKKLDEYFVINLNDYDIIDEMLIKDYMQKNPSRPYKYFVTGDLTKVYIINTDTNELDRIYDLTYESFVEYSFNSDSFDNLLIYTIDKKNSGHEYVVENGIRKQKDTDDYPHKQVNFMIKEKSSNGGSISYTDSNLEPETYTINTMDEFNKKYGKYYKEKR